MQKKIVTVLSCFLLAGIAFGQDNKPWPVPDKQAKMSNPVKMDAASLSEGKAIYVKHCQSCHGKTGTGDGPKAAQLKTQPEDLKSAAIQQQSDGALFYKTSEGRSDMPSFKKKLDDEEDIWNVVNYLRSLKK